MSYTKLTDFAAKDALLSGNPNKLLRGTEIGAEFDAIESAMAAAEAVNITAPIIAASTSKTTPVNADVLPILDSAAANILKKVTWANVKATLKTYFDTLYAAVGSFAASGANADITSLNGPALGAATATTQTATDNSTKVSTTAFVRSVGPAFVGVSGFSTNTTLTTGNYGNFIYVSGTFTLTLPVADATNVGRTITVYGYAAAAVTVATQSSQTLHYQGTNTATSAVMVGIGDTVTFVNYSGTAWMAIGSNSIGGGQAYSNVTGGRVLATTYTNTTGKPIFAIVCITFGGGAGAYNFNVAGSVVATITGSQANGALPTIGGVIPAGATYSVSLASGTAGTLTSWTELR